MAKRILLVDDSPVVRKALRNLFESVGFVCDEAEDGAEAITRVSAVPPDLIVLDLAMPNVNGLKAAPRLREMLPSAPIILFTLYAGSVVEKEARIAGITSIVSKGEAVSNLLTQAESLLNS